VLALDSYDYLCPAECGGTAFGVGDTLPAQSDESETVGAITDVRCGRAVWD